MSDDFFRFPRTPHIAWLGDGAPRDDKLLSPAEVDELLQGPVVVEEKLDGANLGVSVGPDGRLRAQNRGAWLTEPMGGQFKRLPQWLAARQARLVDALGEDLIVFGEWCAARHSLDYQALPDWWLMFDVYDRRAGRFWSTRRRDKLALDAQLAVVAKLAEGYETPERLAERVTRGRSRYRDGALEGIVVRREDEDWLLGRGKLVRADFTQAIGSHWRTRRLEWNRLR